MKKWIADIEKVDGEAGKTNLAVLLDKFVAVNQGKSPKTQATNAAIINVFKKTWKLGLDSGSLTSSPPDLDEWLAQHEARLRHTAYNGYCGLLKQLSAIAASDRIIAEPPFLGVKTRWKKPQKPIRRASQPRSSLMLWRRIFAPRSSVLTRRTEAAQACALELHRQASQGNQGDDLPADFPASLADAIKDWQFETDAEEPACDRGIWLHSENGGVDADVDTGHAGGFVVDWDEEKQRPTPRSLKAIRRYLTTRKKVGEMFAGMVPTE